MEMLSKYESLKSIFVEDRFLDVKRAESLINDIKNKMIFTNFFTNIHSLSAEERLVFCNTLEMNAILYIRQRKLVDFSRVIAQLKPIYFNGDVVGECTPLLLSVYLVYLLSQGDTKSFIIEHERCSAVFPSIHMEYTSKLFDAVNTNSLSRLYSLEKNPPSTLFCQFTSDLLCGARNKFAKTIEVSYKSIQVSSLKELLCFHSDDEAIQFANKHDWQLHDGIITFSQKDTKSRKEMLKKSIRTALQISSMI